MKKLPKSLGLLCSASMLILGSNVAQAASLEQLDNLSDNTGASLVANAPANSLSNAAGNAAGNAIASPVNNTNLEIIAPKAALPEVSSSLPELQFPLTTQTTINSSRLELPELGVPTTTANAGTTLEQNPVVLNSTILNVPNSPINLAEVSTSAGDITPPRPTNTILSQRVGDRVSPYTPTAYIGVGVNLGLGNGSSDLSQGRFVVYGKLGFTQNISLRPAILLGSQTTVLIPITYDFPLQPADAIQPVSFVPYVGGGAIIASGSGNNNLGFLLSGGVDFPISRDFTATAGLNVGFIRSTTDFGILLGIAYNIPGFRF